MNAERRRSPARAAPRRHERGGPRASWLIVLIVVVTGATTMGWAIYALIQGAAR